MLSFAIVRASLSVHSAIRIKAAPAVPESEKTGYVVMSGGSRAVLHIDAWVRADEPLAEPSP